MKLLKVIFVSLFALPNAWANLNAQIKYSSNYLMPALCILMLMAHNILSLQTLISLSTILNLNLQEHKRTIHLQC